jgi:hypothetical protein
MKTTIELRNFSDTDYLQSAPNVLGGLDAFTIQYMGRALAPTGNDEHLMGNFDADAGWRLLRRPGTRVLNFSLEVVENGVVKTCNFSLPAVWGAVFVISAAYSHGDPGFISVFANGVVCATLATGTDPMTPSTRRFSIGYDVNGAGGEAINTSFIAAGFEGAINTDFATNTLETIKRADITDGGMPVAWTYEFSAPRSCSFGPSDLENFGTAQPLGALELVGTNLVRGTPDFVWNVNTPGYSLWGVGTTAQRPSPLVVPVGWSYYDTTLGKPLWSTGAAWKDAAGATV